MRTYFADRQVCLEEEEGGSFRLPSHCSTISAIAMMTPTLNPNNQILFFPTERYIRNWSKRKWFKGHGACTATTTTRKSYRYTATLWHSVWHVWEVVLYGQQQHFIVLCICPFFCFYCSSLDFLLLLFCVVTKRFYSKKTESAIPKKKKLQKWPWKGDMKERDICTIPVQWPT